MGGGAWYTGRVPERLRREVEALCSRLGLEFVDGRVVGCEGLGIAITVSASEIRVGLDGWTQAFARTGDVFDDEAEVDAALDLVGAALFGEVRVVVELAAGRAFGWTLELREDGGWAAVRRCGGRRWWPLVRRTREVRVNAYARPQGYAAIPVRAAAVPWLGRAGFAGRVEAGGAAVELAIDGVLDLHSHSPKDVKKLVLAYLGECRARGLLAVRIVHGKGVGNLRRTVHALLERHPHVIGFRLGGHGEGGWGATLVDLAPIER